MTWLPVSRETLDDAEMLSRMIADELELMTHAVGQVSPLTAIERMTGWRYVTLNSGRRTRYAVGWRARRQQAEADARREAEMAACPYVALWSASPYYSDDSDRRAVPASRGDRMSRPKNWPWWNDPCECDDCDCDCLQGDGMKLCWSCDRNDHEPHPELWRPE